MMGKTGSKHAAVETPLNQVVGRAAGECYLVNAHLNKALEEQIWKKSTKTGYNLANYNMNHSLTMKASAGAPNHGFLVFYTPVLPQHPLRAPSCSRCKTHFSSPEHNMLKELSICLEDNKDVTDSADSTSGIPLKVELPPIKTDNGAGKVFVFDNSDDPEKGGKDQETKLNIEEFECGVHFGGGENAKQEWSFTLYDFDGHGKITKEDLVGLLKALYDAIGSSIKIPSNGTKTLKLRLSVGQENGPATEISQAAITAKSDKKGSPKKKDNLKNKENVKQKDSPKSKVKELSKVNNLVANKGTPTKCNNETQARTMSAAKSRLSSQKHKELAELVQENMERNRIKPLRRHHSDCKGCHQENLHHKRRHKSSKVGHQGPKETNLTSHTVNGTASPTPEVTLNNAENDEMPKESQDRRNYYLDLAGVENTSSKFQSDSPVPTALNNEPCSGLNNSPLRNTSNSQSVKPLSALAGKQFCVPGHFRSRSHEIGAEKKCDNNRQDSERCQLPTDIKNLKQEHLRSKSFDPQEAVKSTNLKGQKGNPLASTSQSKSRFRPISLPAQIPEMVSPHYHRRHRNRERDHDMAMQQVAEWIEREHSLDMDGDRIVIQRHEHHHVHEHHHHHHYHHYYEA